MPDDVIYYSDKKHRFNKSTADIHVIIDLHIQMNYPNKHTMVLHV